MPRKNTSSPAPEDTITSDDVLGKDVIDPDGSFLGIVEKLHLDPDTMDVVGLTVDKGFLKKGLFIGRGYVQRVTGHAVFLSIRPVFDIKGMAVFDPEGRRIGIVSDVILAGAKNQIKSLLVRSGIIRRSLIIPADLIESIGKGVFLNQPKDVLIRMQLELNKER